jgi:hypothetical protein
MLYTLADARAACGRFVESGTSKTAIVDARINEALERVMDIAPLECLRRQMRACTQGRSFALPHNVEKILFANVNGSAARVFGQAYQFLDSGPGDDAFRSQSGSYKDLEDLGDVWPYMYEFPDAFSMDNGVTCVGSLGWTLAAFTTATADAGKTVTVKGFLSNSDKASDTLTINKWYQGTEGTIRGGWGTSVKTSELLFKDIELVTLPSDLTEYCSLYVVDTATNYMYFLAKYHPSVVRPQFRRYRVTNSSWDAVINVQMLVQLRHVPLVLETDLLPVNSVQAVKLAVMALRSENLGDLPAAKMAMDAAAEVLGRREVASTLSGGVPVVVDTLRRMKLENRATQGILL